MTDDIPDLERDGFPIDWGEFKGMRVFLLPLFGGRARICVGHYPTLEYSW